MRKIKSFFTLIIALAFVISLTSCRDTSVSGKLTEVIALRTSIVVKAKLTDENSIVTAGSFSVSLYDSDDAIVNTLTFDETSDKEQTKEFTDLSKTSTYTVRLFATYNSKKYTLDSQTVTTTTAGTEDEPILISTTDEFLNIKNDSAGYFKLNADLDFGGATITAFFTSSDSPFKGNLDGQGHTISNYILSTSAYSSLFGYNSGTIKNLVIDNIEFELKRSTTTETNLGLVCSTNNGTLENITIKNVVAKVTSASYGLMNFGLLCGKNGAKGVVENCNVTDSTIEYTGRVTANIGGLLGLNDEAKSTTRPRISNSSTDVAITFTQSYASTRDLDFSVGGLVGTNKATIEDSYTNNTITISTSKSTSTTDIAYDVRIGGLAGTADSNARFRNCAVVSKIAYTLNDKNEEDKTLVVNVNMGLLVGVISPYTDVVNCVALAKNSTLGFTTEATALSEDSYVVVSAIIASSDYAERYSTSFVTASVNMDGINAIATTITPAIAEIVDANYTQAVLNFINLNK